MVLCSFYEPKHFQFSFCLTIFFPFVFAKLISIICFPQNHFLSLFSKRADPLAINVLFLNIYKVINKNDFVYISVCIISRWHVQWVQDGEIKLAYIT